VTNHGETIDLLERCLPFMEQRYIRCFSGEPWCFLTMHAAIMLLKLHVGEETPDSARSSCGRRFLDLYDEYVEGEQELPPTRQNPADITDVSDTFLLALSGVYSLDNKPMKNDLLKWSLQFINTVTNSVMLRTNNQPSQATSQHLSGRTAISWM